MVNSLDTLDDIVDTSHKASNESSRKLTNSAETLGSLGYPISRVEHIKSSERTVDQTIAFPIMSGCPVQNLLATLSLGIYNLTIRIAESLINMPSFGFIKLGCFKMSVGLIYKFSQCSYPFT
jgi:hypothetical protein